MDENRKWRRLQNEELHSSYRLPNIVRVIKSRKLRFGQFVGRMEEGSSIKSLTYNSTGRMLLGRPKRRLENTIRMNLK